MMFKNMKIGTQLILGFVAMQLFVITIGIVSVFQNVELFTQTETMYDHPLQVRLAIGTLTNDISTIRIGLRDLAMADNEDEKTTNLQIISFSIKDAENQFAILRDKYLGSSSDIENTYKSYIEWVSIVENDVKTIMGGNTGIVNTNNDFEGIVYKSRTKLFENLDRINDYASNKSDSLYLAAVNQKGMLYDQLIILITFIIVLSLLLSYTMVRNIRKPLKEMNRVVLQFRNGDMDARSNYQRSNEFGVLSESINEMIRFVKNTSKNNDMRVNIAQVMLESEDPYEFFLSTLQTLGEYTGSQIAAAYLLSKDAKTYEHYASIGMDDNKKQAFKADSYEGEFGAVLLRQKIIYIHEVTEETRFRFCTTNGTFIPNEIITIPIIAEKKVVAVLSLATLGRFSASVIDFIESIAYILNARISGILAYQLIQEYKESLEKQNVELDIQKRELSAQTTELIAQNAELEMQKKQLNEANQLKTSFLSNMSHELRTPLNSIIALSGVLNRRTANKLSEEENNYLDVIERNGKNLLALINDILDISRIEAGREDVDVSDFNMHELINEVISTINPQAVSKDIELNYVNEGSPIQIKSDAEKCMHILQNLLANAVKFTEKGKVIVQSKKFNDMLELKVIDSGIGISAENIPFIFDEFRQADNSTARRFGGTGLGLAIANKYAVLLGGSITVKSVLDHGSEFTFTLPINYASEKYGYEKNEPVYIQRTSLIPSVRTSERKTILLVEDNESAILQVKELIEDIGHQVRVAHDATEALAEIDQKMPDAMVLDIMMPDIDGLKLLEILRNAEKTAHIPVLILTAKHITKEELKFLKRNNVHQFVQKGDVDRTKLQNTISVMLFPETIDAPASRRPIPDKPTVLVVEDNPDNMLTAKAILDDRFIVIEAYDGFQAIELANKHMPDLILMDIALPGKSGIDAFQEIRSSSNLLTIPVIALTASAMQQDREAILSHGFDAYISKPINIKEFNAVIDGVLYGR